MIPQHAGTARLEGFTGLTRKTGSVHLAATGVVNGLSGAVVLQAVFTDRLLDVLIATLPSFVTDTTLLAYGSQISTIATVAASVVGVGLILLFPLQSFAAREVYAGRRWRLGVAAAVAGVPNPLALPLALVSAVLLGLSVDQFESRQRV